MPSKRSKIRRELKLIREILEDHGDIEIAIREMRLRRRFSEAEIVLAGAYFAKHMATRLQALGNLLKANEQMLERTAMWKESARMRGY